MIKIGMTIYESGGLVGDTESLIVTKENIRLVKSFWEKVFSLRLTKLNSIHKKHMRILKNTCIISIAINCKSR